jgi:hypothetical protein
MNEQPEPNTPDPDSGTNNPQGSDPKPRPVHDTTVSEATRELRDTSRRRRDAEEKLQQHLLEAREHVPHHYDHEPHQHGQEHHNAEGKGSDGRQETPPEEPQLQKKDPEGDAG